MTNRLMAVKREAAQYQIIKSLFSIVAHSVQQHAVLHVLLLLYQCLYYCTQYVPDAQQCICSSGYELVMPFLTSAHAMPLLVPQFRAC